LIEVQGFCVSGLKKTKSPVCGSELETRPSLSQGEDDLSLCELLLLPELRFECLILSKKLQPEWTKIQGSGQDQLSCEAPA